MLYAAHDLEDMGSNLMKTQVTFTWINVCRLITEPIRKLTFSSFVTFDGKCYKLLTCQQSNA